MKKTLITLATCLVLSACAGTNFKWADARKVEVGMSEPDLVALLGKPYMVTSKDGQVVYNWTFVDAFGGVKTLTIPLVDGKVSEKPPVPESF